VGFILLTENHPEWIEEGAEQIPFCKIDGFHLSRSCWRGWENGNELIRAGKPEEAKQKIEGSKKRESKRAKTESGYMKGQIGVRRRKEW